MKRMFRFLCALLALAMLAPCAWAEAAGMIARSDQELTLFDEGGVKLYLTGECEAAGDALLLKVIVENGTQQKLQIYYSGAVNGWSLGERFALDGLPDGIEPESKAKGALRFPSEQVEAARPEDLRGMKLRFEVCGESGEALFEAETGAVSLDLAGAPEPQAGEAPASAGIEAAAFGEPLSSATMVLTPIEAGIVDGDVTFSYETPERTYKSTVSASQENSKLVYVHATLACEIANDQELTNHLYAEFVADGTHKFYAYLSDQTEVMRSVGLTPQNPSERDIYLYANVHNDVLASCESFALRVGLRDAYTYEDSVSGMSLEDIDAAREIPLSVNDMAEYGLPLAARPVVAQSAYQRVAAGEVLACGELEVQLVESGANPGPLHFSYNYEGETVEWDAGEAVPNGKNVYVHLRARKSDPNSYSENSRDQIYCEFAFGGGDPLPAELLNESMLCAEMGLYPPHKEYDDVWLYAPVEDAVLAGASTAVARIGLKREGAGELTLDRCDAVYEFDLLGGGAAAGEAPQAAAAAENPLREHADKATIQKVQTALNELGYECGAPDGVSGAKTQAALRAFQSDAGLNQTGTVTSETLDALRKMGLDV